ncbi:uncharacterized protein LOC123704157 [Colias croceus]|uniref:uncharacterized protein LOC123704157 n=1 Tax=Colias crocea TaxID=72248 RepID=UPI001E28013F|nr:uncharacterized protein LOC123704157 [Colias croceus]
MDLFEARQESNIANFVKSEGTIIKSIERIESVADGVKENSNEYYVYEISAEKPPFKSRNDDEEQVYYAPVYNYAPEFAYYDPHNRFGPNTDDLSKDSYEKPRNKNERRNKIKNQGNNYDNRDKFNNIFNILKQHKYNNVVDPQTSVQNSAIFNPNDYIDMDYFFGRNDDANLRSKHKNGKAKYYFPDTDEDDHPYQSMKNSLQEHIRTIRKLLYAHKQFGYIPERPKLSNKDETRLRSRLKLSDANDFGQNKDDITIDYYFGRKNSHEVDSEHNKLFKLHLAQLKEGSVTPKPVKEKRLDLKEINEKDDFDVYVNVLRDMIEMDNEALIKYDWLRSAVDIRTALSKLKNLTKKLKNNDHIHPNDLELLKYVIYLYKSANESHQLTLSVELLKTITQLRKNKKKSVMPQIKKKQKFRSAIKLWRDFRTFLRSLINGERDKRDTVGQFERFLTDLEDHLYGLHNAIKSIASITKFKKQNWYADLKEIYLKNATKRELLEVILHLGLSRLLALIEDSSESGLEENFSNFVYNNGKEVNVTRQDFIFVLRLLNAIKEIN